MLDALIIFAFGYFAGSSGVVEEVKNAQPRTPRQVEVKKQEVKETCKTEITKIYDSVKHGRIVTCNGKLLVGNQKTRIVYEKAK